MSECSSRFDGIMFATIDAMRPLATLSLRAAFRPRKKWVASGPSSWNCALRHNGRVHRNFCHTTTPYTQGEKVGNRRLYFYWVDHNGYLFLDDTKHRNFTSCYKDSVFLEFFYSRIRLAEASDKAFDRYGQEFRWVSPCGSELNWIRADDTPIVFTALVASSESASGHVLTYANGAISQPFDVAELEYCAYRGRLYHPAPRLAPAKALLSSALTIDIAKSISVKDNGEATITWQGNNYTLQPYTQTKTSHPV